MQQTLAEKEQQLVMAEEAMEYLNKTLEAAQEWDMLVQQRDKESEIEQLAEQAHNGGVGLRAKRDGWGRSVHAPDGCLSDCC